MRGSGRNGRPTSMEGPPEYFETKQCRNMLRHPLRQNDLDAEGKRRTAGPCDLCDACQAFGERCSLSQSRTPMPTSRFGTCIATDYCNNYTGNSYQSDFHWLRVAKTESGEPPRKKTRLSGAQAGKEGEQRSDLDDARNDFFETLLAYRDLLGGSQSEPYKKLYVAAKMWEAQQELLLSES